MPTPPPAPAERLAGLLFWLGQAAVSRGLVGQLAAPLVALILDRLREIQRRFIRLAARVAAGTFAPRRSGGPRPGRPPGRPNRLPTNAAWLIRLVPEAAASASQLRFLLADAEMAALLAAAPASMARTLRPLCRMLGVEAPPVLAPPAATAPATPAEPAPVPAMATGRTAPDHPTPARKRTGPPRVRYVFGLRFPAPFPDPA